MPANENHPFVVPCDATALAALLADPTQWQAIGTANRPRARRDYDQEIMFRAYGDQFGGTTI